MTAERRDRWLIVNYALTVFVSAFLLFQVQPLISRYILPWFGGSPAVWTTCMLFFQCVLFAGYAYAHAINRFATPKWQGIAHLALLAGAVALAYIRPSPSWKPLDGNLPTWRILALLSACVGMPYFVLATTGPLLQAWFSRHYPGRSPYRLYALSNVGSLLALLSYPFLFEPMFALGSQVWLWFGGYTVFVVLCAQLAWRLGRDPGDSSASAASTSAVAEQAAAGLEVAPSASSVPNGAADNAPLPGWNRLLWLILPAFGSYMLLATTNHVCTDVAVIPFLWVVPLSVYLLSFIIAFDHPRWYRRGWYAAGAIIFLFAVGVLYTEGIREVDLFKAGRPGAYLHAASNIYGKLTHGSDWKPPESWNVKVGFVKGLTLHFTALFFICMMCHGELVKLRPPSKYLTAYYLMISAGGAVGGLFVSLIAPHLFTTYFEWNLGVIAGYVLATVLLLSLVRDSRFAAFIAARAQSSGFSTPGSAPGSSATASPTTVPPSPVRTVLICAIALFVIAAVGTGLVDVINFVWSDSGKPLAAFRNFYGAIRVTEDDENTDVNTRTRNFYHGAILHGYQFTAPEKRATPTSYYVPNSGVGRTIKFFKDQGKPVRVGTVGLGVGTLAAYGRAGDTMRFYEINPAVIFLSQGGGFFTFLSDCIARKGHVEVVPGDARLSMDREPDQHYHVLALDAFSGDAIPAHLLTKEAFEIYSRNIATKEKDGVDGAIVIHITNRYLDLRGVVAAGAEELGLKSAIVDLSRGENSRPIRWVVLTRNKELLEYLAPFENTKDKPEKLLPWTDDHSDLWSILIL